MLGKKIECILRKHPAIGLMIGVAGLAYGCDDVPDNHADNDYTTHTSTGSDDPSGNQPQSHDSGNNGPAVDAGNPQLEDPASNNADCSIRYFLDNDRDGATPNKATWICTEEDGYAASFAPYSVEFDCDDNNENINPNADELCDGLDNNCDLQVDEECDCSDGETKRCGSSEEGECSYGIQTCNINGAWAVCVGNVEPVDEICDDLDNNCDGTTDEGITRDCSNNCGAGLEECIAGIWRNCDAPQVEMERCDGEDNDCDSVVDNDCINTFESVYSLNTVDEAMAVQQTVDGGYIFVGYTGFNEQYDAFLIKTDAFGNEEWSNVYGGQGDEQAFSVQQSADGGYVFVGWTESYGNGGKDVYLVKVDGVGDEILEETFGGVEDEVGFSLNVNQDGSLVMTGRANSEEGAGQDVFLLKTDELGSEDWFRTYGGMGDEKGLSVIEDSNQDFVVAGVRHSFGGSGLDILLLKADRQGNLEWSRTYGEGGDETAFEIKEAVDRSLIAVGKTNSEGAGLDDICLLKTSGDGREIWKRTYGGAFNEEGQSVQLTTDDNLVIVGSEQSEEGGDTDLYLVKVDLDGRELWSKNYGGMDNERGYFIQETVDGGFVAAGHIESRRDRSKSVYMIRTNEAGDVQRHKAYGTSSDEVGLEVIIDGEDSVVVGWTEAAANMAKQAVVMKYDSEGNQLWQSLMGEELDEVGQTIVKGSDGNYVIAGSVGNDEPHSKDIYLSGLDVNGNPVWSNSFGGPRTDVASQIKSLPDEGYLLVGSSDSQGEEDMDVYLAKVDMMGIPIWQMHYGGAGNQVGMAVEVQDDGFVIAGYRESFGNGGNDIYVLKTDTQGSLRWSQPFGGDKDDIAYAIRAEGGGYVIAGSTESEGAGGKDAFLLRIDDQGFQEWFRSYGGVDDEVAYSILPGNRESLYLVGSTSSFGAGGKDVYLVKADGDGRQQFFRAFGGHDDDEGRSIVASGDEFIISGWTDSFGAGGKNIYIIRTDEDGNL